MKNFIMTNNQLKPGNDTAIFELLVFTMTYLFMIT